MSLNDAAIKRALLFFGFVGLTVSALAIIFSDNTVAKIYAGIATISLAFLTASILCEKNELKCLTSRAILCAAISSIWVFGIYYWHYYLFTRYSNELSEPQQNYIAALYLLAVLIVVGFILSVCISKKYWQYPWFPLFAFCTVSVVNYDFDWAFMWRWGGQEIDVNKFKWSNLVENTLTALREVNARMVIEAIEFVRAIAVIWLVWVSLGIVLEAWGTVSRKQKNWLIACAIVTIGIYGVLVTGWVKSIPIPWTEDTIFSFLNSRVRVVTERPGFSQPIRRAMTTASHLGLIFAAFAIGLVVAERVTTVVNFRRKFKSLRYILYPCAAVMLLHVVCMSVWQLRAAALLSISADSDLVRQMAATIGLNTAVCYVCILFTFHIPAVDAVLSQVKNEFYLEKMPESDQAKWFKNHRLEDSWPQFYTSIFAMLAPLIASLPLAKLFVSILG